MAYDREMNLIVDLHVHSRFSRATSKDLNLPSMYRTAKMRGIQILGTGDFTHPKWFEEIRTQLVEKEEGLFELVENLKNEVDMRLPENLRTQLMRFVPTVEISNIYKRGGKVRRVHNVIVAPSLQTVAKINTKLETIGNLHSDGRPILGLDSEDLLKIVMEIDDQCLFIPAHIWTPWFAIFGSKSGFDSLEEAFGESRKFIKAVETGLSADPAMCRKLSQLDDVVLLSNSDAHSCAKLGREANVFDIEPGYESLKEAIDTGKGLLGTIEFYPQEGKYHGDGHATCGIRLTPDETKKFNGKCPVCNGEITVGVEYRVESLADQRNSGSEKAKKEVHYIVPLPEILLEVVGVKSVTAGKVQELYMKLLGNLGTEFEILTKIPLQEIAFIGIPKLTEAIERVRTGNIVIEPGYDGIFGKVKVFEEGSQGVAKGQVGLW